MMIEDFCKFAMRKKSVYLMKLVPQLMHAGFISQKTFDAICRSFTSLVENRDQKLSDAEVGIVKVSCLEAAKAKWADKTKLKKEQPQIEAFKEVKNEKIDINHEDELVASKESHEPAEEIQIDTTEAGRANMTKVLNQIGKKRSRPAAVQPADEKKEKGAPMRKERKR